MVCPLMSHLCYIVATLEVWHGWFGCLSHSCIWHVNATLCSAPINVWFELAILLPVYRKDKSHDTINSLLQSEVITTSKNENLARPKIRRT